MTVSLSGSTGSAAGMGWARRSRMPLRGPASRLLRASARLGLRVGLSSLFDRDPAGRLPCSQRQLDPQDAVLVGGPGRLRDDVGAQLHDAPERTGLDLHLLVDATRGLLDGALAGDDELPVRRSRGSTVSRLTPASSTLTTALGAGPAVAVVDVDARREPHLGPAGPPGSPQASPNSSSISRRMRSKFTSRSRSARHGRYLSCRPPAARATRRTSRPPRRHPPGPRTPRSPAPAPNRGPARPRCG